jgi:hypothetical protein
VRHFVFTIDRSTACDRSSPQEVIAMLTDLIIARSALDLDRPNIEEYARTSCGISSFFKTSVRWLDATLQGSRTRSGFAG